MDHGFSTAAEAQHALELILEQLPDAALLDIGLPAIDGCELSRGAVRAQPSTANSTSISSNRSMSAT
jgi:CheY-like chemotaxis protein